MDPFSLTVGAISIVGVSVGTCAKLLHDIRSKYKGAGLTIASMTTECVTIQTALCQIESLTSEDPARYVSRLAIRPDLKAALDTAITGCTTTFAVLEDELDKLCGGAKAKSKLQYVWNESAMQDLLHQIRSQYSAIHFLMMAIQSESLARCTTLLQETIPVLQTIAHQTRKLRQSGSRASLRVAESIFSDGSSQSKVDMLGSAIVMASPEFSFDKEIIGSEVYRQLLGAPNSAKPKPSTRSNNCFSNPREANQPEISGSQELSVTDKMDSTTDENKHPGSGASSKNIVPTTSAKQHTAEREVSGELMDNHPVEDTPHMEFTSILPEDKRTKDMSRRLWCREYKTETPRSSTETYASTVPSEDPESEPPFQVEPRDKQKYANMDVNVIESNPANFADFFPSTKRLLILHDNTTCDGNMNLRIETRTHASQTTQLFHLRMHNLKDRKFSLRRYCRSSGREVCHSIRKMTRPKFSNKSNHRPSSVGEVLSTIRRRTSSAAASISSFRRTSSNRGSISSRAGSTMSRNSSVESGRDEEGYDEDGVVNKQTTIDAAIATNSISIEFSNYAQVELTRRGAKSSKRYEFEYWGHNYTWKRTKDIDSKSPAYHLYRNDENSSIAHIIPDLRSPLEVREDEMTGGWVQPCSMWISDQLVFEALLDVAE